jgi:hypothetical protein
MPTPQAETMFRDSFDKALDQYRHLIDDEAGGRLALRDRNFDTGMPTRPGAYFMADRAYARLVDNLAKNHFQVISPDVKSNILAYYKDPTAPIVTKKSRKDWERLNTELNELRTAPPSLAGATMLTPPAH